MYVIMYVCMYVIMYVCMYVIMYVCMYVCHNVCMYVCMYVRVCGEVRVCMCIVYYVLRILYTNTEVDISYMSYIQTSNKPIPTPLQDKACW